MNTHSTKSYAAAISPSIDSQSKDTSNDEPSLKLFAIIPTDGKIDLNKLIAKMKVIHNNIQVMTSKLSEVNEVFKSTESKFETTDLKINSNKD